ncbi:hypothetical protein ACGFMM_33980 [Streptomyces sp. NPDC048604]|uniref:hypothetical protein n=1 Tax=Streptomyces sp. NPDC048604 TaxID=3365578 RepID=UPI00371B6130
MATSDRTSNPVLRYLESRKNLAGSAAGLAGLVLTFTGLAGAYWPVVIAGLYGAGALIAPPDLPPVPPFPDPEEELDALRENFATLRTYLAEVDLPPAAAGRLTELDGVVEALLDPRWVADVLKQDPESVHTLSRAVRQDIPEAVDAFVRTRWWNRVAPGAEPPERHLERQLNALHQKMTTIAGELRDAESRRQQAHTIFTEDDL